MIRSSARRWSSKAMPYCMPEHPPPLTKMRRARPGFSSWASNSLSRDCASGVSETRACSITVEMLPRASSAPCPPYTGASARGARAPLPPSELDPFRCLGLGGGRRTGDDLSQLLRATGQRTLGVGQDQDLALDGGLVRLGAIELDLHRQLLLECPDDVLLAHDRLGNLVVEGEDHAPRHDVEDVGEDVQQLADVLER